MKLHSLHHVPFEGLGAIEAWARDKKFEMTSTNMWEAKLPAKQDFDWLVIMGGPMNVDEEHLYPWLAEEKKFIGDAIAAGKKVLGVCLGAQLIARALGAKVFKNAHKEIGWMPVTLTAEAKNSRAFGKLPAEFTVFHWHGDTFELPKGAVRMAGTEACRNQAFIYGGNTVALQFHLESTPESVALLTEHCEDELVPGPYIQKKEQLLDGAVHYRGIFSALSEILNAWLSVPLFLVLFCASLTGCSKQDWLSKYYVFKAENALSEAAVMKEKRIEHDKRVPVYAQACRYFREAYEVDSRVFTLNRIEEAADSCWRCGDAETEELFKVFEEEYIKKHPQEFEHGDSGVAMMEMG